MTVANSWTFNDGDWSCQPRDQTLVQDQWGSGLVGYQNERDGELAEEGRSDLYGEGAKELSDPLAKENEGIEPGGIDLMSSELSSEHRSFSESRTDSCQDMDPEVQSVHQPRGPRTGALNSRPQTRVLEHHSSNLSEDSAGLTLHESSCNKGNGISKNKHCFLTEKAGPEDALVTEVRHRLRDEEIENLKKQKSCPSLTSRVGILEDGHDLISRKPGVGQNMGEEDSPSTVNGVVAEARTNGIAGGKKAVKEKNIVNRLCEMRDAFSIAQQTVTEKEATTKDNIELMLVKEGATNMERDNLFTVEEEAINVMKEVSTSNVEQETSTSKEKDTAIRMELEGEAALSAEKEIVTRVGKEAAVSVVKEAAIEAEKEANISVEVEVVTNVEVEAATNGVKEAVTVAESVAATMEESDNNVAKEAGIVAGTVPAIIEESNNNAEKEAGNVAENAAATMEESDNNAAKEAVTVAETAAATMEESDNIVAKEAVTVAETVAATMEESGNIVAKEAATSVHEKAASIVVEAVSGEEEEAAKIGENEEPSTIVEKDAVIVEKEAAFPLMVKETVSSKEEKAAICLEGEASNGVRKVAAPSGDIKSAPTVDETLEKEADIKDVEEESLKLVKKQADINAVKKEPSRWEGGKKSCTGELVCAMKDENATCKIVEEVEAISSGKLEIDNTDSIVELEAVAGILEKEAFKRTAEVRLNKEVTLGSAFEDEGGLSHLSSMKLLMEDKNVQRTEGIHVNAKSLVLESESGESNSCEETTVDRESDSCEGAAVDRESDSCEGAAVERESDSCDGAAVDKESDSCEGATVDRKSDTGSCEGAAVDRESDSCKGAAVEIDLQGGNFHEPGCPKVVVSGKVIISDRKPI
jgi:hypothetical protein